MRDGCGGGGGGGEVELKSSESVKPQISTVHQAAFILIFGSDQKRCGGHFSFKGIRKQSEPSHAFVTHPFRRSKNNGDEDHCTS